MGEVTIGEVARRAGVKPSALRYYEYAGILPPARKINGRRHYSEDLVRLVEVARYAQSVGFSLAEIRELFRGFEGRPDLGAQWRPLAIAKLKELDLVIAKARRMKAAIESGLDCGCIRIQDCLPRSGRKRATPR